MGYHTSLKPFAESWSRHHSSMERRITRMSDKELLRVRTDCAKTDSTNCWFAVYEVAQELSVLIDRELSTRDYRLTNGIVPLTLTKAKTMLGARVLYRRKADVQEQHVGTLVSAGYRYLHVEDVLSGKRHKLLPPFVVVRRPTISDIAMKNMADEAARMDGTHV